MNDQWFQSSTGSGDLALTFKGALVALVPLALIAIRYYNLNLDQNDLVMWTQAVSSILAAGMVLIGLIRKAFNKAS